jgi:tetratricopeptide (TPR) repeat protein
LNRKQRRADEKNKKKRSGGDLSQNTSEKDLTIDEALALALTHHQAGQLDEAEQLYSQILSFQPDNADALHLLGAIGIDKKMYPQAMELLGRALVAKPDFPEAYNSLGAALAGLDRIEDAAVVYNKAVELKPDYAEAYGNLGLAFDKLDELDAAIGAYTKAVEINPKDDKGCVNLGNAFQRAGETENAIGAFEKSIRINSNNPMAYSNLGNMYSEQGKLEDAVAAHRKAIVIDPGFFAAYNNLGTVLEVQWKLSEATDAYRKAIEIAPDQPDAYANLAIILHNEGKLEEAIATYAKAIEKNPDHAKGHSGLGMCHLVMGNFAAGLPEYEWRLKRPDMPPQTFSQPTWDGKKAAGKTIFLHAEQGFGDAIQFIRYAEEVGKYCDKVIFEVRPPLVELMKSVKGVDHVVIKGDPVPSFDFHAPLLSLPLIMETRLETIPAKVPYLTADPGKVEQWRLRLGDEDTRKIGLVWSGNPDHRYDRNRSIPLKDFAPILRSPGCSFVSLQVDDRNDEISGVDTPVSDYSSELKTFSDTAALIANLDLIISVDTSVVHLAGALGRPVWVLLPQMPDWRWLLDREDSPWYPSARLFRQQGGEGWGEVIDRTAAALVRSQGIKE